MFNDVQLINLASLKLKYSASAQNYAAQNIANADTPGYRAARIKSFQDFLSQHTSNTPHIHMRSASVIETRPDTDVYLEPNHNNVSLEDAMIEANRHKANHAQAVAISKSAFDILRVSLGR